MGSRRPYTATSGLLVDTGNLPESAAWQETVERLHRLTLLGLGEDVTGVRVELLAGDADAAAFSDIECRLTVRLRKAGCVLNIETRHPDGTLAVTQAFARAQREAQRQLNGSRRAARRHYLSGNPD
jgi:hypothetical protein